MSENQSTRRQFHQSVAALTAAAPLAVSESLLLAQEAKDEDAESLDPVAKNLLNIVRARFGKHLSADQLKSIGESIAVNVFLASKLQEAKLNNSDEPAFIFPPDVYPAS